MTIDETGGSRPKQIVMARQELQLQRGHALNASAIEPEVPGAQIVPILQDSLFQASRVLTHIQRLTHGPVKEACQHACQRDQVGFAHTAVGDGTIQHARGREPAHLHDPVHYPGALSVAQGQRVVSISDYRHDIQVYVGRQPAIEHELFTAAEPASGDRTIVQESRP